MVVSLSVGAVRKITCTVFDMVATVADLSCPFACSYLDQVRSLIDAGVNTFLCLQENAELRRFTPYMKLDIDMEMLSHPKPHSSRNRSGILGKFCRSLQRICAISLLCLTVSVNISHSEILFSDLLPAQDRSLSRRSHPSRRSQ